MNKKALNCAIAVIEEFRRINPEMQAQQMLTLLLVAKEEGITPKEVGERIGISQAAASRCIADWTSWTYRKETGPDFIEARVDMMDTRRKLLHLKPKGRAFVGRVTAHCNGGN
jgi:DNA-binding MarR family transcriptional regulator